ncbi:unnamed protein product [Symbiodinium sp. CCMP2456]|nr:unnamed protein product [Symbiodinium sp. CCMP2456]
MLNGSRLGSLCWRLRCSAAAVNVRQDLLRKTWPQAPPEWIEEAEAKALLQPHLESPDLEDALAAVLTASTAYAVPSPAKEFVRTRTLLSLVEPCDAHVLEVTLDSLQFASVVGDEHISHAYHVRFRLSGAGPWVNSPTFVVHDDAAEGPVEVQMGTAVRFVVPLCGGDSLTHLFKGVFAIGLELQLREEFRESNRANTILQGELAAAELHALCADIEESEGHGSFRTQLHLSRPGAPLRPCLLSCSAAASQGDWLGDHVSLSLRFARAVAALDASPWPCEAQAQAVAVGPEDGLGIPGLRVSVERFFASLVDDPRPADPEEPPPFLGRPESGTEGMKSDAWEELDDLLVLGSPTPRSPEHVQESPTSSARSHVKDEPWQGDKLQDMRSSSLQASVETGQDKGSPIKLSLAWSAAKSAEVSPTRRSLTQHVSLDAGGLDDSPLTGLMTKHAATNPILNETDEALGSPAVGEAAESPARDSPHRASWPAAVPSDVKDPLPAEADATEVLASQAAGLPFQVFIADEILPPAAQLRGDLAQRIAELDQLQHSLLARIGVDKSDAAPSDSFKKSGEADDVDETDAAPQEEIRKESDDAGFPLLSGHLEAPSSKESVRELPDEPEPACEESLGGPDADDSHRSEGDLQVRTTIREVPGSGRKAKVSAFRGAGAPPPRSIVDVTPQHLPVPTQASGRLLCTLEPQPGWAQLVEGKPSGLALGGRGPLPVSLRADAQESGSLGTETSAGRCEEEPISLHSPAPTELPKTSLGLWRKSPETALTAPTTALTAMSEAACQTTWSSSIASEVLSWTPFRSPASARLAETQHTATAMSLATSPPRQFPPRPPLWSPATTAQPSPDRSQESPTLQLSGAVPSAATTTMPGARTRIQLAMKWSDRLDEKTKRLARIMHGRKRRGDHDEDSRSSDS